MILRLSIVCFLSAACATGQASKPATGRVVDQIDPRIWDIHQSGDGDLWFGSNGNGVYRYDGERLIHYTPDDGLSGLQVRDIEEDSLGNVFIATNDGVSKFDGDTFETLEIVEAAPGEGWVLDPEDVWVAFDAGDHGPYRYDGERLYRLKLPKSPAEDSFRARFPNTSYSPSGVYTIYEDRRGYLWFGTSSVGLCRFDGRTISWMYEESLTTTPEGGAFGIRSIFQDSAGDFWICNTRQRFAMADEAVEEGGYSLLQYDSKPGLPNASSDDAANFTYSSSMAEDVNGTLWMACGVDGVLKYEDGRVTRYPIGDEAFVMTIHLDRDGKLWVGTVEQGVYALAGTSFERVLNG